MSNAISPITPFERYNYDEVELNRIFREIKGKLIVFHRPKFTSWLQSPAEDVRKYPYIQKVLGEMSNILGSRNVGVAFLWQQKNSIVQPHIDPETLCAVNHILSGVNATIWYPGIGEYQYKTALIDTSIPHGIRTTNENRIVFKISIFDLSYKQVRDRTQIVDI